MKPMLKPPGTKHLKLKCDRLLSTFAVKFNLRHYNLVPVICSYLAGDVKKIQKAIILGSSTPLLMFLSWDAVALGLAGTGGGAVVSQIISS